MSRDNNYLQDILESARPARRYIENLDQQAFENNQQIQDAVTRRIEIMGEATRRLSESFKAAHPELPWHKMLAMRNVLIHQYDEIDLVEVWKTVVNDLPGLIAQIEPLIPPPSDVD
jgi:uncharacterized protein with HEPN domain